MHRSVDKKHRDLVIKSVRRVACGSYFGLAGPGIPSDVGMIDVSVRKLSIVVVFASRVDHAQWLCMAVDPDDETVETEPEDVESNNQWRH